MTSFVSHSSLMMLKFPNLNFEDSYETLKFQTKTETSNPNFQHQVESSNSKGHGSPSLTIISIKKSIYLFKKNVNITKEVESLYYFTISHL